MRHARELRRIDVARLAEVSPSTITRLEEWGHASPETVSAYVEALQAAPVPNAVTPAEAAFLLDLTEHDARRAERAQSVAAMAGVADEVRRDGGVLGELLAALRDEARPAVILDPLYHILAMNGPRLALFGLSADDGYLARWEAWHAVAGKLAPESPIRARHVGHHYLAPLIRRFFEDTSPWFFTPPHRRLVAAMQRLSPARFGGWWRQATSLTMPDPVGPLHRAIMIRGDPAFFTVTAPHTVEDLDAGPPGRYALMVWEGLSEALGAAGRAAAGQVLVRPAGLEAPAADGAGGSPVMVGEPAGAR